MKKGTFFLVGVVCVIVGGVWFFVESLPSGFPQKASFHNRTYTLEVAATDERRTLGLGGRQGLCETCGMLFIFEHEGEPGFWMKGMHFSLDIAWLLDDTVVHIERHVPWNTKDTYYPGAPANQVLEFRAGTLDDMNVGEKINFSFF